MLFINNPKSLDTSDFPLANKIFHSNLCVCALCIIISALLYLIHFLSLHKSLIYSPSVYILYDEYSEDVIGEYSSLKYQWRNWGKSGVIAPPSRKRLFYLKKCKNEIFHLFLSYFNFWPATEKCYYVSILTGCQNNS